MEILTDKKISKARLSRLFSKSDPTAQRWFRGEQCPEVKPWDIFEVADQLEVDARDLAYAIKEAYESAVREREDESSDP